MQPIIQAVLWDLFCKVIDNHGDIGVCWRLAAELAARGQYVRLWADDASALQWMAPQGHKHVQVVPWTDPALHLEPGDVVVEAFGCDPPSSFVAALKAKTLREGRQPPWVNLEYLSAEAWVERSHGLPSPVLSGPGEGLVKHFFFPGFTAATGGLLREADLGKRKARFDRSAWLARQHVQVSEPMRLISLFCYEPAALHELLTQLARGPEPTMLLVTAGRARAAVQALLPGMHHHGKLSLHLLPLLSQEDYDHLLWACDLNFVRGEDSLVRALWAERPFVWQAYPQEDGAHGPKVEAFLDWLQADDDLRRFHRVWNGLADIALPRVSPRNWQPAAELAARRARSHPELAASLLQHVSRTATI